MHLKPEEEKEETLNIKNDLALHRLISESHLLASPSPASSFQRRQTVLDMRVQALGAKKSVLQQEKMPLSHRKGINAKVFERDAKRRAEAKENGIILEREKKTTSKDEMRIRGVGGPGVGRFKGGMLHLSERDVASITGPRREGQFKKRKGRP